MFGQMIGTLEVQTQMHAELAGIAEQDRLGRRLLRERSTARAAVRRVIRLIDRPRTIVQPA